MSRLPNALQPAWPLAKRAHRGATRAVGSVTRRTAALAGDRAVPAMATTTAEHTVALAGGRARLHAGGDGERLCRPLPFGSPAEHWVFRWRATYDVGRRFTLELERGTVVGSYAAHITSDGVLDFETSAYFGIRGWHEHPLFLRSRLPAPEEVDGTVVSLAVAGSAANYYHFVTDVLPRWGILGETMPGARPDVAYLNTATGFQRQLIAMLGLDDVPVIEPGKHRAVRARRLLVPSLPNPDLMAPHWTTSWLKERLPARRSAGLPRRLYVTRGHRRNTRRLVDESEHLPALEQAGFVRLDPGRLSVQEQIDHFAAAEAIVAPHGAALTNLVFCQPGVRVLELFAPDYVNPCYWTITDNIPDARYHYLVGRGRGPKPGAPMNGVLSDIRIDPVELRSAVERLLD